MADRYINDRFLPDKAIDLIDEAGARLRIRRMTAPPDLREFDEKIAEVRREKEAAIDGQDFEKAARLRDDEKQLTCAPTRPARGRVEVRRHGRRRRGRRGAHRRGAGRLDRHPGLQADRGGVQPAAQHGGRAAQADRRHGRRDQGALPGDPAHPRRPQGPARPGGSFIFAGPTGVGKTELPRRSPSSSSATRTRSSSSTCPSTPRSTPSRGCSAHLPATSATKRVASSPRRCAASRSPSCSSTRSRRPTRTSSTACCRCSRTAASPTPRAGWSTSRTPSSS
jgi:ATP-dependent Clp protease ATP-binding subunit ClpC